MLLQTNSYLVPKESRAEHARLLKKFRQALARIGCTDFEVYEQVSANWSGSDENGRFVQIMRFRDKLHQNQVQAAERNDPVAQGLIRDFCGLINFPYQQQQGLFAVGFYTAVLPPQTGEGINGASAESATPESVAPSFPQAATPPVAQAEKSETLAEATFAATAGTPDDYVTESYLSPMVSTAPAQLPEPEPPLEPISGEDERSLEDWDEPELNLEAQAIASPPPKADEAAHSPEPTDNASATASEEIDKKPEQVSGDAEDARHHKSILNSEPATQTGLIEVNLEDDLVEADSSGLLDDDAALDALGEEEPPTIQRANGQAHSLEGPASEANDPPSHHQHDTIRRS